MFQAKQENSKLISLHKGEKGKKKKSLATKNMALCGRKTLKIVNWMINILLIHLIKFLIKQHSSSQDLFPDCSLQEFGM